MNISGIVTVGTQGERHNNYKIESSNIFLNGYNSKRGALQFLNPVDSANRKRNNSDCDSTIEQLLLENENFVRVTMKRNLKFLL